MSDPNCTPQLADSHGRVMDYLRLAVTDRCNFRCVYCLPDGADESEPHTLSLAQIERILRVLGSMGVRKVKITGGEPLVHPEIVDIVRLAKNSPNIVNVTLTTNGLLLDKLAPGLIAAGLDAVNISLDTLDPARFHYLTRRDYLPRVLAGLDLVLAAGDLAVKVNCVPTADSPMADLLALAGLAKDRRLHVRYIELMPIGLGQGLKGLDPQELTRALVATYGPLTPVSRQLGNGPATYFALPGFVGRVGFISAVQSRFCDRCNRLRVTADGFFKTCLHMDRGLQLPLADEAAMVETIRRAVRLKPASHLFNQDPQTPQDSPAPQAPRADQSADPLPENRLMSRIGG
ncbi:MAG: GTP 3',8-cyclase MoaA [Deltaproteobacteria bacterium]|jgi:cyclic pyranopterin phosphate synthase|nr:GTP 3',8-cyclase MoaA [Deltaproteobacteria bacterium]